MDSCIQGAGRWLHDDGYLIVGRRNGRNLYAHRVAWEEANGAIPSGHHVHHKCRNKACVNVEHLELLTVADHQRQHRRKCGHDPALRVRKGRGPGTRCRACRNEYQRTWREKRRVA